GPTGRADSSARRNARPHPSPASSSYSRWSHPLHSSTPSQSGSQTAEAEEKPAAESPPVETGFRPAAPRPLQIGFGLAALVLAIVILYLIRDVLGAFVLGTLIAFLITPAVDRMHQAGIPRAVAILVLFGVIIGVLAALVSAVL